MKFSEVVGQSDLKHHLVNLVAQNHLPHAMMLLGKEGSGGLPMAMALTQFLMCENRINDDSCDECSACTKNKKMQHPDVHFSFPTFKKDSNKIPTSNDFILDFRAHVLQNPYANDIEWLNAAGTEKQGNITASECREIIQKLQLRSFESEYKVLIMWYPEYLGNEGNVLLKMIEEPTKKTILMFVAHNLDNVLMTIQSRTQLFPLKKLDEIEIQQALNEKRVESGKASQIARLAEGNFNYALHLLSHHEDDDLIYLLRTWLNCLYTNKGLDLVAWLQGMSDKSKETQKGFLVYFIHLLENSIRCQQLGNEAVPLLEAEQKIVEILIVKGISTFKIAKITDMVADSVYQIERNAHAKILFHSLSLRIQQILLQQKSIA
jgi:DNA polymerase III subunit delta'